jgi:hypothetical protein
MRVAAFGSLRAIAVCLQFPPRCGRLSIIRATAVSAGWFHIGCKRKPKMLGTFVLNGHTPETKPMPFGC